MALCPVTGSHFTECAGDHNSPRCLRRMEKLEMPDDDRDFAEENYWRNYCEECDGACRSTNGHADIVSAGYIRNGEMTIPHPPTWPGYIDNRTRE